MLSSDLWIDASLRQAEYANKTRKDIRFNVGDKVRLSTVNLKLPSTMSAKLQAKFVGPCSVIQVINPVAYKLKLPDALSRLHPVFHISLLQPWRDDKEFPDHVPTAPLPAVYENDDQYYVEALLDKRVTHAGRRTTIQYLVRWKGYGPEDDQWVAASNIEKSLIDAYNATHHAQLPTATRSSRKQARRRN